MAETPETPTPSLAERDTGDLADDIEAWADVDASSLRSGSRVTSAEQLMGREPDLRAAAAQLREKDAEIERLLTRLQYMEDHRSDFPPEDVSLIRDAAKRATKALRT